MYYTCKRCGEFDCNCDCQDNADKDCEWCGVTIKKCQCEYESEDSVATGLGLVIDEVGNWVPEN